MSTAAARVLTVEDDPIVRADLRLILEEHGFDVSDARDGLEAVELARELRPDLVLIDLNLPNLDGVEATRRILGERDVAIVALTGRSGTLLQDAVDAGATDHLTKPFSERGLVDTVRGALATWTAEATRADHDHIRLVIESMQRANRSEASIATAVDELTAELPPRA